MVRYVLTTDGIKDNFFPNRLLSVDDIVAALNEAEDAKTIVDRPAVLCSVLIDGRYTERQLFILGDAISRGDVSGLGEIVSRSKLETVAP